jgi:hypothetical protein
LKSVSLLRSPSGFLEGDMLDQTLISILLGVLAVLGTLGGALGGTILANRHAMKLEELRIEQEKLKRNTAVIEEVYTLFEKINSCVMSNISNQRDCLDGTKDNINRVQSLIYLYLPSLKEKFKEFNESLELLTVEVYGAQIKNKPIKVWEIIHVAHEDYRNKLIDIRTTLEKMVK